MNLRTVQRAGLFVWRRTTAPLQLMAGRIEEVVTKQRTARPAPAPLFIIGAPRSGSTLLYQVLSQSLDVAWFTNRHAAWYGMPTLIERLSGGMEFRTSGDLPFASAHGRTMGPASPSEAGEFWYRWFPRDPHYVGPDAVPAPRLEGLIGVLGELERLAARRWLIKNMHCALRLESLGPALPAARFLVIRRDRVANARSLLASRKQLLGDYSAWWSMRPRGWEVTTGRSPVEQVFFQIDAIHRAIDESKSVLGHERFLEINYEEFCAGARATVAAVREFSGIASGTAGASASTVPDLFTVSAGPRLPDHLEADISRWGRA